LYLEPFDNLLSVLIKKHLPPLYTLFLSCFSKNKNIKKRRKIKEKDENYFKVNCPLISSMYRDQ